MKKCAIYVRNAENDPASFYRIIQYVDKLDIEPYVHQIFEDDEFKKNLNLESGIRKKVYQFFLLIKSIKRAKKFLKSDISNDVDIVFVQRTIIPRVYNRSLRKLLDKLLCKAELIWDFDDNIKYSGEIHRRFSEYFEEHSTHIIVTHEFLKETVNRQSQHKVTIIPTTDSILGKLYEKRNFEEIKKSFDREIRLVWVGTSSNLHELKKILPQLEKAAQISRITLGKQLILNVVCNKPLISDGQYLNVKNYNWSREVAYRVILKSHIGLMPLTENEYTKGKGAFKLIQYIAAGVPIIGSGVGYNKDVIDDSFGKIVQEDWAESICEMSRLFLKWNDMSLKSRKYYEREYYGKYMQNLFFTICLHDAQIPLEKSK